MEHVDAMKIQQLDAALAVALEALILLAANELNLGSVLEKETGHTTGYSV